jgi:two-component system sensor histidine kinase TctE
VVVQVAETLGKRNQLARDIITGVIFPQFLILPLSVVLVYLGLTRGLRPLSRLQERIRERRPDDMSPIDERYAPDEVKPLVASINDLLAKLASTLHTQRRFIADAAHQMKTPLAGLRTQAELAMRQTDPDELRKSLRQLARSTQRATHVINQLLLLARTENQGLSAGRELQSVDLAALAREVLRDLVPLAMDKRLDLGLETPEGAGRIAGQPLLLRELLRNLVDNAIAYTPAGGSVTVRVEPDLSGRGVLLAVEDTGPGIAPAERERVFDPFYRGSDTAAVDGSGLGLAIVKEIAMQHGAQIRIDYNPRQIGREPPGTLLQLRFPAAGVADEAP